MSHRRIVSPPITPGSTIARMHLALENPMFPKTDTTEIHVSMYPDGDITKEATWYEIYEHIDTYGLEKIQRDLTLNNEDMNVVDKLLGSFRWVMIGYAKYPARNIIVVDERAIRGTGWTTEYF